MNSPAADDGGPAPVRLGTQIDGLSLSPLGRWLLVQRIGRGKHTSLVVLDAESMAVVTEWAQGETVWSLFLDEQRVLAAVDEGDGFIHVLGYDRPGAAAKPVARLAGPAVRARPRVVNGRLALVDGRAVEVRQASDLSVLARYSLPAEGAVLNADADGACLQRADGVWRVDHQGHAKAIGNPPRAASSVLLTDHRIWLLGEFGRGLFVAQADGTPVGAPTPLNDESQTLTTFAISDDECRVLIGNASGHVRLHDIATGQRLVGRRLHRGHVTAACFARGGASAFSASATGEVCRLEAG